MTSYPGNVILEYYSELLNYNARVIIPRYLKEKFRIDKLSFKLDN